MSELKKYRKLRKFKIRGPNLIVGGKGSQQERLLGI